MKLILALSLFSTLTGRLSAFAPVPLTQHSNPTASSATSLLMAMDDSMRGRLDNIKRSYQALTERLADPDVIADSNLLMKVRDCSR